MQSQSNYVELIITDSMGQRILLTIGQFFEMAIDPVLRVQLFPQMRQCEFITHTIRDQEHLEDIKFIFCWLKEFYDLSLAGC